MKRNLIISMLTMSCAALAVGEQPSTVTVEGGRVCGTVQNELTVFRGIPFAAPPVGDLRWCPPRPVKPWDGVLQADAFAPAPIQGGRSDAGVSEDCLYLNVWTPAKSANEKLPVLVWIHGGAFSMGSSACSGGHLAKKGVVLVSIGYRVGELGFLAHPELSAESPNHVSGNYGLLDQIAGLQWIQKNIASFGGDPAKVTIFGESAGGIAVSMLCASPQAKGLFQGAISQSGGSFGPPRRTRSFPGENMKRLEDAERDGLSYQERLGVSSLAEMRKLPPEKIVSRGYDTSWPVIDGWVITDDQYKLYTAGKYNDVDILVGYNSDEGLSFWPPRTAEQYIAGVKDRYGPFADKLIAAYPAGDGSGTQPKSTRDLMRDAVFGWHTWSWARLQAKTGQSKVYLYYFDQHPDYPKDSPQAGQGSPHGMDVAYVFQDLNPSDPRTTKSDLAISDAMATYWTNFAKHGDPNGKDLPRWPQFSDENPNVMVFSQTPHAVKSVPDIESLKVLDNYFSWRRTPEGETWGK
ncbi:MAG: carboxylesterase family protein [Pontiellaceae bacterium]|nr:carboxylesterase family protein [Pontiellaceae bacterium]MBN2786572.1 carboxylesterase family protein [Pontiellaceae bacterium]